MCVPEVGLFVGKSPLNAIDNHRRRMFFTLFVNRSIAFGCDRDLIAMLYETMQIDAISDRSQSSRG
jgi:hypothetical protein